MLKARLVRRSPLLLEGFFITTRSGALRRVQMFMDLLNIAGGCPACICKISGKSQAVWRLLSGFGKIPSCQVQ
jgi:hypothetical protein